MSILIDTGKSTRYLSHLTRNTTGNDAFHTSRFCNPKKNENGKLENIHYTSLYVDSVDTRYMMKFRIGCYPYVIHILIHIIHMLPILSRNSSKFARDSQFSLFAPARRSRRCLRCRAATSRPVFKVRTWRPDLITENMYDMSVYQYHVLSISFHIILYHSIPFYIILYHSISFYTYLSAWMVSWTNGRTDGRMDG